MPDRSTFRLIIEIALRDDVRRADDDDDNNDGYHAAEESKIELSACRRSALNRVERSSARFNGKTLRS
jgi:hypothetical protein